MNLKLIHIKYRFYLQILLFVAFLIITAFFVNLLVNKHKEAKSAVQEINDLKEFVNSSYNNYNSFINHLNANDVFYQSGSNVYSTSTKNTLNNLKDTINYLSGTNSFAKRLKHDGLNDSICDAIKKVTDNFTIIEYILKDIGSVNHGNIGGALENSTHINMILDQYNSSSIASILAELRKSESVFLFANNQQAIYDIASHFESLQNDSVFYMLDYMVQDEVRQVMITYLNHLTLIQKSREQLGAIGESTGLYNDTETAYHKLSGSLKKYIEIADARQMRYSRHLLLFGIFIILVINGLYLLLLIQFFAHISHPLNDLNTYTYKLAKGQQNISNPDTNVPHEFASLINNLDVIFKSIHEKKVFVDHLLKQNFDVDLALHGKHDNFGKTLLALKENMRKTRDEELKYAEENKKRQYQNEGVAKFAEILRKHNDNLITLANTFIKEIVRYLDAIQGGLFLLENEGDDSLYLASAFAYNRKKYLTKDIKIGETLVGTCALEKKTTVLNDIPGDYIEITSGLGDAPPNNLILIPVMHDGILIGVLEVASLKEFSEIEVVLCEDICESLASTIINARVSARTTELLQKSQQQAAEMAEQEEEMRQNMEELQATQEESGRKEEELEGFLEAIDQTFYVLEYSTDGSIIKVNQRFLYLTGLSIEQVIGKKHQELFGERSKADSSFFANVSAGNIVDLTEIVEILDKKLEIKNTFSPIKTRSGETTKILNIMSLII